MNKMNHSQMHLHSENFDLCRVCLLEPEANRHIKFVHIFSRKNKELKIQEHLKELLNIQIRTDDICPKILCGTCFKSLLSLIELKRVAVESQIVIKYIAKKKFGTNLDDPTTSTSTSTEFNCSSTTANNNDLENKTLLSINKSKISVNSSNVSKQSTSSNQFTENQLNVSESDNNDDDNNDDDNDDDFDDDDISCQELSVKPDIICISDSEESISDRQETVTNNELIKSEDYCTICRNQEDTNHDCSKNNQEFSTCLVPNCNILSRSMLDFEPHYRQHIGMPSGAMMCMTCYKEIKNSEHDMNGFHTNCHLDNIFKCYTCNIVFDNISEFAYHKLKTHNGCLMNAAGNYLCFYCEKSSPDLMNINEHITHCRENKIENVNENKNELVLENNYVANINEKRKRKRNDLQGEKIPPPSNNVLFTCLKSNCNLIFQSFPVFKYHYREHFEIGNQYMCWQCCKPFFNINTLRIHQVKGNCRTPGMFKCFFCSEKFNDLQCLSIHKFTMHDGELICKNKKSILCAFCKITTDIDNFKNHLVKCQSKNNKTVAQSTTVPISTIIKKPRYSSFKCECCTKVCITAAALSSHKKIHDPNRQKRGIKNQMNNTTIQSKNYKLSNIADNKETDTSSSSSRTPRAKETKETNYLNNLYLCVNCPKQFHTRKGLAKHCTVCPTLKHSPKKDPPKKYYCTKCKEYFTHSGFAEHWRVTHGIRLTSKRRCPCNKCPFLFMYKIALLMHKEHVHGEIHNTTNITDTDAVDCETKIPASLAINNDELMETNEESDNIKTEYQENTNKLLDTKVQREVNEESVKKAENSINDQQTSHNNDDIDIENIDVCDIPSVNPSTSESNECEVTLKDQVNNKDKLMAVNVNEINDNNKDESLVVNENEIIDSNKDVMCQKEVVMNSSETKGSLNTLVEPMTVNDNQNINGTINENETITIIENEENQNIIDIIE